MSQVDWSSTTSERARKSLRAYKAEGYIPAGTHILDLGAGRSLVYSIEAAKLSAVEGVWAAELYEFGDETEGALRTYNGLSEKIRRKIELLRHDITQPIPGVDYNNPRSLALVAAVLAHLELPDGTVIENLADVINANRAPVIGIYRVKSTGLESHVLDQLEKVRGYRVQQVMIDDMLGEDIILIRE